MKIKVLKQIDKNSNIPIGTILEDEEKNKGRFTDGKYLFYIGCYKSILMENINKYVQQGIIEIL